MDGISTICFRSLQAVYNNTKQVVTYLQRFSVEPIRFCPETVEENISRQHIFSLLHDNWIFTQKFYTQGEGLVYVVSTYSIKIQNN